MVKQKKGWRKEGEIKKRVKGRIYFLKGTTVFSAAMKSMKKKRGK
jgi:hypothetical protein